LGDVEDTWAWEEESDDANVLDTFTSSTFGHHPQQPQGQGLGQGQGLDIHDNKQPSSMQSSPVDLPLSQIDTPIISLDALDDIPTPPSFDTDHDDDSHLPQDNRDRVGDGRRNSHGGNGALQRETPATTTTTSTSTTTTAPTACYLHEREVQGVSYEPLGGIQGLTEMGINDVHTINSSLQDIARWVGYDDIMND